METEDVKRGEEMFLSTPGKPMKVKVGTESNPAKRPKEKRVMSAEAAFEMMVDCDLPHDKMEKVFL